MKLAQSLCCKVNNFYHNSSRCLCKGQAKETNIRKHVYISQSTDIFFNLAVEDWIYNKVNFTNQEILMLWKSKPCVVIGRHQNPWLEANVDKLPEITTEGVKLARRNSGGGTVYHDEGNLNITFFTAMEKYNRNHNLRIITRALFREYKLNVDITKKEDLAIRGYKISGTAAKLGRTNAYHHCTLLVNSNKNHLHQALNREGGISIKTRATQSIKSPVMNLKEEIPNVNIDNVLKAVGFEFLHAPCFGKDNEKIIVSENGFHFINPTEAWFPGIKEIHANLESWHWIFGKCPEFSESHNIEVLDNGQIRTFNVKIAVENGRIHDVKLDGLYCSKSSVYFEEKVTADYKGKAYSAQIINDVVHSMKTLISDNLESRAVA